MEIFMRNIAYSISVPQITREVSEVVHGPAYAEHNSQGPFRFIVAIHGPRRGRGRAAPFRTGTITFPNGQIGEQFLLDCGNERPRFQLGVNGKTRILFSESNKPPKPEVLDDIRLKPFVDPRALAVRNDMLKETSESINISAVQFGWECRDEVFSIEWETSDIDSCHLRFDGERRDLRVFLDNSFNVPQGRREIIVMPFSHISHSCAGYNPPSVVLWLYHAPLYEADTAVSGNSFGSTLR